MISPISSILTKGIRGQQGLEHLEPQEGQPDQDENVHHMRIFAHNPIELNCFSYL